jgi:gluconate 2-dehydrogenase gamma chain
MGNHDASRRTVLFGAAAGVGTVAGAGLVPEAYAQSEEKTIPSAPVHANNSGQGAFFNPNQAIAIAALADRLMPGAPGKPGARDAGVLDYIDLALAGAYADLREFYRCGLASLDAYCRRSYGAPFADLDSSRQDQVIKAMEQDRATEFGWPSANNFFSTLRTHTMEGMFGDPIYGGNKNFAGWRLLGFPGVQSLFTPADLESQQAFSRMPMIGLKTRP